MKIESRKPCIDEPVPRAGTDTHVENMRVDMAAGTSRESSSNTCARAHTHTLGVGGRPQREGGLCVTDALRRTAKGNAM